MKNIKIKWRRIVISMLAVIGLLAVGVKVKTKLLEPPWDEPGDENKPLVVKKEDPHKTLPQEPLTFLNSTADSPPGRLLYLASVHFSNHLGRRSFFVLRGVGQAKNSNELDAMYSARIPIWMPKLVYEPQFVLDGKAILFKYGWPYDNASYQLALYNLQTEKLEVFPPTELYGQVAVSPAGDQVAFLQEVIIKNAALTQICAYDLKTKHNRFAAKIPQVADIMWTRQNTLLYDSFEHHNSRLGISEITKNGSSRRLIKDGYAPVPSPDGKWIAYFSWMPPRTSQKVEGIFQAMNQSASLCLYHRASKKSIIGKKLFNAGEAVWTPDSQRLVLLEKPGEGDTVEVNGRKLIRSTARVLMMNMQTRKWKLITPVVCDELYGANPTLFRCQGISRDGKRLFIITKEATDKEDWQLNFTNGLQSIDLNTGRITAIARAYSWKNSSMGLDWQDLSNPVQVAK